MSTRKYVGPFAEIEIPALRLVVANGDTFDDPDDLLDGQESIFPKSTKKPASPAVTTGEAN